jgi:beta-lactam-binding protein with PASTA domain
VKVKVPNVFGNDPTSAAIRIQNAKLRVFIEPRFIKSDPRILIKGLNTVVDQDPKADTEVDPDTNVTIFVLRLRGSRFDTDLKGLTPTTAKELQRFKRAAEKPE